MTLSITSSALLLVLSLGIADGVSIAAEQSVDLIRDKWGTPHVFADTDAGAMYGLGYAVAEDRGFQMHYFLRIIQGRVAEVLGDGPRESSPPGFHQLSAVQSDRKMRTFGFSRAARRVVQNLDSETLGLLQSYSNGVNDYFAEHQLDRHYLFEKLGLRPEKWMPADCLLSWWHLTQFFAPDGLGDPHRREDIQKDIALRRRAAEFADDDAVVIRREDVSDAWIQKTEKFLRDHGLNEDGGSGTTGGPKFSHAWVVSGKRTTTGSAVLVSDPQVAVTNPSLFYEFHVRGATFNVRGIGVAGSPMILIGFNRNVAWGLTALSADQADLFRLKTDPAKPNQYQFDGQWRDMDVFTETIRVKDGDPVTLQLRESWFGPVVTDLLQQSSEDDEFSLRRVPISISDSETIQSLLPIWRAQDVFQFRHALSGWQFPSANCLFGDSRGNIGYTTVGVMPIPPAHAIDFGRYAHAGYKTEHDWQGMVPHDLVPHVLNPLRGYLWSGNNRVIGRYYKLNIRGTNGETRRSRRLREMLEARDQFEPQDVLDMHFDSVNPARRDFVRLGLHLQRVQPDQLSSDGKRAVSHLESWYRAGASSALTTSGAELAVLMDTKFFSHNTPLSEKYGSGAVLSLFENIYGGYAGLSLFMRDVVARIEKDRNTRLSPEEVDYLNQVLSDAWAAAREKYGPDSRTWLAQAQKAVVDQSLGYHWSIDGFGSLDPSRDLPMPATRSNDIGTIFAQQTQSYTQFVPLDDADQAQAILPIGSSERPGSRYRTTTLKEWETGELHPAPLSRVAVDRLKTESKTLAPR